MALKSDQFSGDPALEACLVSDPAHVGPGATGAHVGRIQRALAILGELGINDTELSQQRYGTTTADAVLDYKKSRDIRGAGQRTPDNIVGKMTISKLDSEMAEYESNLPSASSVIPTLGTAGVQVGPLGWRRTIVADYYHKCALETVGPGQVRTVGLRYYATLEELIDTLQARSESQQVVVNHGDPERGLLMPFSKETPYEETGKQIAKLSGLADILEKGNIDPNDTGMDNQTRILLGAADYMNVAPAVVLRVARKLVALRKKNLVLHLRACHLEDAAMLVAYKSAFGAQLISYHPCRLLFLKMTPQRFKAQYTAAKTYEDNLPKLSMRVRERLFDDPIGLLWPMLLAIQDLDGHTHVESYILIEHRNPEQIAGWAEFFLREWRWQSAADGFVMPVMWQDDEHPYTFYCPLEQGWRDKLQWV